MASRRRKCQFKCSTWNKVGNANCVVTLGFFTTELTEEKRRATEYCNN